MRNLLQAVVVAGCLAMLSARAMADKPAAVVAANGARLFVAEQDGVRGYLTGAVEPFATVCLDGPPNLLKLSPDDNLLIASGSADSTIFLATDTLTPTGLPLRGPERIGAAAPEVGGIDAARPYLFTLSGMQGSLELWALPDPFVAPDLDAPAELIKLEAELWTGMTLKAGVPVELWASEWQQLHDRWTILATQHAATCSYQCGNTWVHWNRSNQ